MLEEQEGEGEETVVPLAPGEWAFDVGHVERERGLSYWPS
jgi:hypothetical protein